MSWIRPKTAIGLTAAIAILAAAGWYGYALTRPMVTVTSPFRGAVVQAFYSTGTVSPIREYPVRAQVGGVVTDLRVDKGTIVRKGDLIAVIEDPTLNFLVAKAQAELREKLALADETNSPVLAEIDAQSESVAAVLDIAQREYDRVARMRASDASTSVDLDRALDRVKTLTSEKASLKARREMKLLELRRQSEVALATLEAARAEQDKQKVLAPADGSVLDRPMPSGTRVDAQMNNELMTIADVSQDALIMRAQVDEEDVAGLSEGQAVKLTLYAYGPKVFDGKVARIYDKADPERRTFEVDVAFDRQAKRIAAGMTGELAFILAERPDAMVVPAEAIQLRIRARQSGEPRQGGTPNSAAEADMADEVRETVVWTVREGGLHPNPVKVGLRGTERVEILEGLSPSDTIVITAIDGRTPVGRKVRTTTASTISDTPPAATTRRATETASNPKNGG